MLEITDQMSYWLLLVRRPYKLDCRIFPMEIIDKAFILVPRQIKTTANCIYGTGLASLQQTDLNFFFYE